MNVGILITGSEFATGSKQDTNSSIFAKIAFERGLDVAFIHICKDIEEEIEKSVQFALEMCDILIVSGGLGPTFDDVTRQALSKAFNEKLIYDEAWLKYLENEYSLRNVEFTNARKNMALRLLNSKPITNDYGKALGFIYEKNHKVTIVLPGIPQEAKSMLIKAFNELGYTKKIREIALFRTFGLKESDVSSLVKDFGNTFINVSALGVDVYAKESTSASKIEAVLGKYIYAHDESEMEEIVGKLLRQKQLTIATAESSTGGLIVSRIVNVAGSSDYCLGGIVSYSNQAKMNILGVKEQTLKSFGAVSEQTAKEMLLGAKRLFGADIVLADTGIAGPGGGTSEKPVGLHYIGIMIKDNISIYKEIYQAQRNYTRLYISQFALNLVRLALS
ncbi:nicotinamide-nucleotide amidohydrolase family protein [Desulfurella multipotens]|uniref:nicotinamide-nucleotide amidohydrolase family protein n=1 Tax=Desulfurella multipotens TaxID=79269 RepID=UPI000CC47F85|nr:nicotinamide-nucleotide amidohydrolase family protein [Desulfurella multipotens]PMP63571.1 MAG: damage-inducible protein CinA [Desulfurella multipotens]